MTDPSFWDKALIAASGVVTWLVGESGRALVAGAAGGGFRWLMAEKRRLRDGMVAVIAGAISAQYLAPLVIPILRAAGLRMSDSPDLLLTSGFLAGLAGMSFAKLILAALEARIASIKGGGDDTRS